MWRGIFHLTEKLNYWRLKCLGKFVTKFFPDGFSNCSLKVGMEILRFLSEVGLVAAKLTKSAPKINRKISRCEMNYGKFHRICTTGLQEEIHAAVVEETDFWYNSLCRDFKITPAPIIRTFLTQRFDVAGSFGNIGLEIFFFSYSLPILKLFPDKMFMNTIPHEVCHGIARHLYGEKIGHGEQWKKLMEYVGLEPEPQILLLPDERIALKKYVEVLQ